MNQTSYQQPGQTGRAAMGQPAQGLEVWNLESQVNALGNVALTLPPWLSSQTPHHAAQQTTQSYQPLPTITQQFTGQRPSVEGQVRIAGFFVTNTSILTRPASSPSH